MTDPEARAYELLQWVPYSLSAPFDEELAQQRFYTDLQRQRSNHALDAWEHQHPSKSSLELQAFRELERLGIYSQRDFFRPEKAKHGNYTEHLRRIERELQGGAVSPQERRNRRRQSRTRI
jgi:hypothetical protein